MRNEMLIKTVLTTFVGCLGISISVTQAAPLIPFTNGTPADATEVNANFTELETRINTHSLTPGPTGPAGADGVDGATGPTGAQGLTGPTGAQGPTGPQGLAGADGVDGATGPAGPQGPAGTDGADGTSGGTKVMSGVIEIGLLLGELFSTEVIALNSNGYFVKLNFNGEILKSEILNFYSVVYVGTNCTGNMYIQLEFLSDNSVSDSYYASYGEVFNSGKPAGDIVYIPKNPTAIPAGVATQSSSNGGVCTSPNNQTAPNVVQIFANNEGITGVPDAGYAPPITFQ